MQPRPGNLSHPIDTVVRMFDSHPDPGSAGDIPPSWDSILARETRIAQRLLREPAPVAAPSIPPGLDEMEPGLALAAFLSAIELDQLEGADRVAVLRAHQRMANHHQANAYVAMTSIRDAYTDMRRAEGREANSTFDAEDAAAEIRAALHLTRRSADNELTLALSLAERLPDVLAKLRDGSIDSRRARVFDNQTMDLPADTARDLVSRILPEAGSLTTGQLRSTLGRLRMEVEPHEAALRYESARNERRVVIESTPEGTAHLHAMHLPPHRAQAIMSNLTSTARELRCGSEARSTDQLRTDVLVDMLTNGAAPSRNARSSSVGKEGRPGRTQRSLVPDRRGTIHLHVDLDTLAALAEHPGDLQGYGPVVADVARQVAAENAESEWRFTVVDRQSDVQVSGVTRRRPTVSQRRAATNENATCVFPGCRVSAHECDVDHVVAWADGGRTDLENLAPLCRHDHRIKHQAGWQYRKRLEGVSSWVSPLDVGHVMIDTDPWRPRPPPDQPG